MSIELQLEFPRKFPHYWICEICAEQKGGEARDNIGEPTCEEGRCPYCGDFETLLPICHFEWGEVL